MSPGRAAAAALIVLALAGCAGQETPRPSAPPALSAKEQRLAEVFIKHRSPHPVELARVVARMQRPRLAAAQAIVESRGDRNAIGTSGERGVWQVIEREWGPTPRNIQGQADQYERIMEEMISASRGNLRAALGRYNGDRSGRYAARVMNLVSQVKL